MGEYAQAIAVGRATALSAAQEMLHTKRGNDNDDDTTAKNTTAQQRQNSPSDWALGAYGSTFVLAPSFSLRLGAEDSLLLRAAIQHDGLAVLLQSELSGRYAVTIRAVLGLALCQAMRPALRPSILVGQDRAHASASQHASVLSLSLSGPLPPVAGPSSLACTTWASARRWRPASPSTRTACGPTRTPAAARATPRPCRWSC